MNITELMEELALSEKELRSLIKSVGAEFAETDQELDDSIVAQVRSLVQEQQKQQETDAAKRESDEAIDGTIKRLNPTLRDLADNLGMTVEEMTVGVERIGIKVVDPERELTSEEGRLILDSLHIIGSEVSEGEFAEVAKPDIVEIPDESSSKEKAEDQDAAMLGKRQDKEFDINIHKDGKVKPEDVDVNVHETQGLKDAELNVSQGVTFETFANKFGMTVEDVAEKAELAGIEVSGGEHVLTPEESIALEEFIEREMLIAQMQSIGPDDEEEVAEEEVSEQEVEPEPEPEPEQQIEAKTESKTATEFQAEEESEPEEEPEQDLNRVEQEQAALDMITEPEVSEEKPSSVNKLLIGLVVLIFMALGIMGFAMFKVLSSKAKVVEPQTITETVTLIESQLPSSTEGDVALLRLIWRMDSDGFYKSAYEMCERFQKEYPTSDLLEDVEFKMADILYKWEKYPANKQYLPASDAAQYAASKYPQSNKAPWAMFLKGNAKTKLKLYDESLEAYREIIKAYPDYGRLDEVQYSIGESYYNLGKFDVAEKEYLRVLSRFPASDLKNQVYFKLGLCLDKQNRFEDAISAYRRFLKMFPEDLNIDEAQLALANVYFRTGDYVQAKQTFRRTIGRYPYDTYNDRALYMIAQCLAKEKDYKGARKILDELIYNYKDSEFAAKAFFKMGDYYYEAKNMRQAVKFYETAIDKYPKHELVRPTVMMLGNIYLENREYEKAISFYRDRLLRFPDVAINDKLYLMLGKAYFEKGIYIAAVNAFDKVNSLPEMTRLDEDQLKEALFLKAEAYFAAQLFSEAKESYMRMLNKYLEHEKADYFYYRLGLCSYNLDQYAEAVDHLQVGMEKYPLSKYRYRSRFMVAKSYRALERIEKSIDNLERLVGNEYLRGREVYYDAAMELADMYHEQEIYERSLTLLDEVIKGQVSQDTLMNAVRKKGLVLQDAGSVDKMISAYQDVIKILLAQEVFTEEDQQIRLERITDFYLGISDALYKDKQYEKSLSYYEKAYKTLPDFAKSDWAVYQMGNCYNEMDDYKQANVYYELLKEEYPDSYWARQLEWNLKRMKIKQDLGQGNQ